MSENLLLLPYPRHLEYLGGELSLTNDKLIVLDSIDPQSLRFTARQVQQASQQHAGVNWQIVAGKSAPPEQVALTFSVVPGGTRHPQGYELTITPAGIAAVASTPAGAFYAGQTLIQMLTQGQDKLPLLRLSDWPDFPQRGVMLDISRDKVPTLETLFDLVDMLASWKINQFQLYNEHTFAYRQHPEVWAEASPLTGEEMLGLDTYCRERFVELVPNQNSFGHMRRWLTHERYNPLSECPGGCDTEWGYFDEPFTLCPGDPGSLELVRSMFDELLPHFSSSQFNVGCDETVDLGQGRSKDLVAERGAGRVYLDFLLQIYREVKARGRTMQFWGDIIMAHPELAAELPRDLIALEWGYEAGHLFDEHGAKFAASGVPFYVCPGTSSWNTVAGRTDNALGNLRNAAENGLKHGAVGYLNTDWGDNGHWQPLPVSYLGYAGGAAFSWAYEANREQDIAQALNAYAFEDVADVMGRLAYDLGNVYQETGMLTVNSTSLFHILQNGPEKIATFDELTAANLQKTLAYLDTVMAPLSQAQISRSDAGLIRREFTWAADMLRHACRRGIWALGRGQDQEDTNLRQQLAQEADQLLAEHREIWLARNRPGGFKDSQARLEKMRCDYGRQ
ncbi:glycoside hydrolase family 20 zincin-like fold domain-containing protein [Chloroflexota bacterium]